MNNKNKRQKRLQMIRSTIRLGWVFKVDFLRPIRLLDIKPTKRGGWGSEGRISKRLLRPTEIEGGGGGGVI